MLRKIEDVSHLGRSEGVDTLCVVTNDGKALATWLERQQDARLEPVGVLIFVD
jgi:hypothetical protein